MRSLARYLYTDFEEKIRMSFSQLNLNPDIAKAIHLCGYKNPTPIQARCIPDILKKKDIIASAQTGTGKTAAFVLPALHHLSQRKSGKRPRILILTPTRELANQITTATQKYGKFLRLNIVSIVGGTSYRQQLKHLSRPVDMIVATPGRLLDHMENHGLDLSGIEMLVLDESDRMLDMGFIDDVKEIAAAMPKDRQTLLFSATLNDRLSHIIKKLLKNPLTIDLSQETLTPPKIKQMLYLADNPQHKNRLLKQILKDNNHYKTIIFSATKINADKLARELRAQGYAAAALHGDLKQNVRNRTTEQFRQGRVQYLVATDVAARGIDITDVSHVINFDLPKFCEDYVHRIGRTGRAGKTGIAISFALASDTKHLQRIERYTQQKMEKAEIEGLEASFTLESAKSESPRKKKRRNFKKKKRARN